ncbi:MAG: tetratricopeptide repeat protein [Pyrinomonadaceae bacterium]|nr:tetratricopeptide repeat protein [Pyrinomonadaceae bacterium]
MEKIESVQEDILDAATKNMLAGMEGTRREVALIVINTVNKSGAKIVGVGSWISGGKYLDPLKGGTSDHDLRLVMQNVSEAEAIGRWNAIRDEITRQVETKFGGNAQKVLQSINLYPPEVVLEGIDDAEEALTKLKNLKVNPNLGGAQAEGLWGKGAKAFRDTYEKTSGRIFWKEGNKVASGFADLLPLGETSGIYTIEGSANTASQFADKIDDAIRKYDPKTVRKNLHRLRDSLKKGRDLARVEKANYLDDLIKKFDAYGDDLEGLKKELMNPSTREALDNLVGRAKMDAELLKKFATSSHPRDIQILKEMLEEGTGRWARVKNTFSKVSSQVPWGALLKAFMAYLAYVQVKDISQNLGAGEQEKVFQTFLTEAGFAVSLPAGILSLIVSSILEDAKDAGYSFVTRFQDCEDLIAGIYEVKGREQVSENQKIETNIDRLAKEFTEESRIIPIVALHARLAASRGIDGKVTQKVDAEIEKKLNERCAPKVVEKWRNRRAELIGEAAEILQQIEKEINDAEIVGVVNPSQVILQNNKASAQATANLQIDAVNKSKQIQKYIDAISQLGGAQKLVAVSVKHSYRWKQDGKEISFNEEDFSPIKPVFNQSLANKTLNFNSVGQHSAQLEYVLQINLSTIAQDVLAAKSYLTKDIVKTASFFVEVIDKEEPTPTPTPSPTPSPTPTASTNSSALRFGGTMPDIYEGGNYEQGFELKRQNAKMTGTGECKWVAQVHSTIYGKIGPSFVYNEKDIQEEIDKFTSSSKAWGKTVQVREFAIGDFKGKFADSSVAFYPGGWGDGFRADGVSAEGRGWVIRDKQVVAVGYNIGGAGCWENSDQAFLMSQAKTAQAEAKAIVNSLTLIGGIFAKTPYKGPKLDGSDMPKLKLVVSPDVKKLKKGDVINVQAVIENEENAEKPFEYKWTGDHAGSGANVKFLANKPGKQSLSLNVPSVGSASVEFEVADLKAEITLVSPTTAKVTVGAPVSFSAKLLSGGEEISGNYIYRFQPSPEVKFDTNESAKKQTNAIFSKPGREKVWVQVLEKKGETLEPVAKSEQIEVEIGLPELKITFDQEKALVGKAVKAKVEVNPADLKDIDFRWELPSNARQTLQSPDAKEVTFIPQDLKPITVKVNARVPVSGEDLGTKEATITAQKYDVRVNVLGAEGPKPQVWKEGVGLVTVENGIAIHQFVGLRAEISPLPENPRYEWMLNADSHFAGNSITQQIRVSRSQTGTCEATVIVRDKDGIELGRGSGTFNVSVSQIELDKAKTMGSATGKLNQAKEIIKKGQLDEAITLVDEVLKASPKNTEAATLSKKWKKDRTTITAQLAKVRSLIDQQMFPEASNEMIVAKNLHNLYPPVLEIEKELNDKWGKHDSGVNLAVGEVRLANEARDFKKALELAKEIRAKYRLMSGTEQTLKNYEDWATTHEAEKNRQRAILAQGEAKFNAYDYEGAIKDFDVMWGNNHYEYWSIYQPEPKKYGDLRNEAFTRLKRINELMPLVGQVVDNPNFNKTMIQTALKNVEEVLQLQPTNAKAQEYKTTLTERLGRGEKGMQYEQAIKKGNEYSDAQNYGEAIKEYDKAIKADGKSAEAYRLRGRAKRANGDLKGALKDFDKSLELNPNNSKTFVGRGLVREKIPDLDGALSDYSRAIELDSNYTAAYSNRGGLRIDINDFQGAITDFDKVISLDPKNTSAYINRGVAKTRLENYSEALKDYNKAIELDSTISLTYNNRGYTKEKLNDLKGALSDYEKAVALDPNSETAQSRLSKLKEKMQGNQVAVKPNPTPLPTSTPKPTPTNIPAGKEAEIFNNMNIYGVQNKPTALTKFTITKPHVITYIFTYHWNNASGNQKAGFIGIYNDKGEKFGPWQARGTPGQGGVPNANWEVFPNITIPAGTYTIVVSSEETWSQNSQSGGKGMAIVKGYATGGNSTVTTNKPPITPNKTPIVSNQGAVVVAVIQNRSNEAAHIFAEGDNFGPHNKIPAGGSKEVSVKMTSDGRIKFFAGRNGVVITSKIWTGDSGDTNRYPKVIFDGNQLLITTGLR